MDDFEHVERLAPHRIYLVIDGVNSLHSTASVYAMGNRITSNARMIAIPIPNRRTADYLAGLYNEGRHEEVLLRMISSIVGG